MFVFLTLYILILGPPLLIYTVLTKNPDPLYWTAIKGVMFFVNAVGVRVRVKGVERIPAGTVIFAANHTSSADAPAARRHPSRNDRACHRPQPVIGRGSAGHLAGGCIRGRTLAGWKPALPAFR